MTAAAPEAVVPFPQIDATENQIFLFVGRKHSGKSAAARELFRHWGGGATRLVIDPTGDADPGSPRRPGQPERYADDLGTVRLNTLPKDGLPKPRPKEGPGTFRWIADPLTMMTTDKDGNPVKSKKYFDDLDRAVSLALFPRARNTLVWVDEAGEVFPAGQTGPYGRTLLMMSRHYHTSALICCPRPMGIDPLVLAQADRVFMFDVPGVDDRKRLAGTLGWPLGKLVAILDEVRALPYHYVMYVSGEHRMYICPPMART